MGRTGWAFVAVIALGWFAVHTVRSVLKINRHMVEASAVNPELVTDDKDVAEIGYIYETVRWRSLWEGESRLSWQVVVPATNERYVCEYFDGYPDFKKGDSVQIVHTTEDGNNPGYILGLYGAEKGKIARTDTIDLFELEVDDPNP